MGRQGTTLTRSQTRKPLSSSGLITVRICPTSAEHELLKIAKNKTREATQQNATQQAKNPECKKTREVPPAIVNGSGGGARERERTPLVVDGSAAGKKGR